MQSTKPSTTTTKLSRPALARCMLKRISDLAKACLSCGERAYPAQSRDGVAVRGPRLSGPSAAGDAQCLPLSLPPTAHRLLETLDFRSTNDRHRPMMEALALIRKL